MDSTTQGQGLFNAASSCAALFRRLTEASNQQDARLLHLKSQFDGWAAFTGALTADRQCLDNNRLFQLPDVERNLMILLRMIERNLRGLILGTSDKGRSSELPASVKMGDVDGHPGLPKPEESSGVLTGLPAVSEALSRMNKLGAAIRRSSRDSRMQNVLAKTSGACRKECLLGRVYEFIRQEFPNARDSLVEQSVDAVYEQREKLLHLQRHNQKLGTQGDTRQASLSDSGRHRSQPSLPACVSSRGTSETEASIPDSGHMTTLLG
ncbi:C2H2 type zinc finger domain protein [Metarhizium album ARSEF 1941]|uniref:C2H2 type zinc finger domain protein n=1 Tax=Metarhizium album (strain ARSEF 1941) TaxID=1081103 RepID=A0A0B2WQA1_METAS|nr:C2H2 type zinc finger domain protein [Metarhizium album ARSEF 1941]KHN95672.1 C2H2 type zinc finger domain protein [Metarhizium album ARSEF 1941]